MTNFKKHIMIPMLILIMLVTSIFGFIVSFVEIIDKSTTPIAKVK